MIDPAILDSERPRGIDTENGDLVIFKPRAKIVANVALIAPQRRDEPTENVIERNIVVSRDYENREAGSPQPVEIGGCFAKLGDSSTLGQITADDDEIGLTLLKPGLGRANDPGIIRAEVKV
jgi:hypothetical protein